MNNSKDICQVKSQLAAYTIDNERGVKQDGKKAGVDNPTDR